MSSENQNSGQNAAPVPFGRFYLQERLNSGGMAEIWLATDARNKPYALRRMHHASPFAIMAKRRFLRGCEILSKIGDHDNIISYVEHGSISGKPYLLMEYIEAQNLKELYARHDVVLTENVAEILIGMALGLEHIHMNGFMHLDFKPENVLVTRNVGVRIIDFDLAQPIPAKPKVFTKKNPGTPSYMAPEQMQGQPLSHQADMFSFGVTAYELLTNQKPFPGDTPAEILRKQLDRSDFVPPRKLNPDVPPALEKVILQCLELSPQNRYAYMSKMSRELQEALYV